MTYLTCHYNFDSEDSQEVFSPKYPLSRPSNPLDINMIYSPCMESCYSKMPWKLAPMRKISVSLILSWFSWVYYAYYRLLALSSLPHGTLHGAAQSLAAGHHKTEPMRVLERMTKSSYSLLYPNLLGYRLVPFKNIFILSNFCANLLFFHWLPWVLVVACVI